MTHHMCPHCGYDLEAVKPVSDGPFAYSYEAGMLYNGERLRLKPQGHILLGTLLLAHGGVVPKRVLAERMGSESDDPSNIVNVNLHEARRAAPFPLPVQAVWGRGLGWVPGAVA